MISDSDSNRGGGHGISRRKAQFTQVVGISRVLIWSEQSELAVRQFEFFRIMDRLPEACPILSLPRYNPEHDGALIEAGLFTPAVRGSHGIHRTSR